MALALALAGLVLAVIAARGTGPEPASAASHREAPLISLDGPADISDFFMFRSYEPGNQDKVVLVANVNPGAEPSSGPNYYNFDPSVTYAFHVDNDRDGRADDVSFEFKFRTEIRGTVDDADLFLSYLGGAGPFAPITALDGPGSEGLGLRQRYDVTMVRGHHRTRIARGLIAVPSNVGPRTMPNYNALAAQGINEPTPGVKVFAGQRQDPFYIDLGGVFDTFNFRRPVPALTAAEDANDDVNPFGVDMLSGFNVSTIALEVPAMMITGGSSTIGAYASTGRPRAQVADRLGLKVEVTVTASADPASRQPADQRDDHRHRGQGRVEHAGARTGAAFPRLLPQPTPRTVAPARLRRAGGDHRPRGSSTCCSSTSRATRGCRSSCA